MEIYSSKATNKISGHGSDISFSDECNIINTNVVVTLTVTAPTATRANIGKIISAVVAMVVINETNFMHNNTHSSWLSMHRYNEKIPLCGAHPFSQTFVLSNTRFSF